LSFPTELGLALGETTFDATESWPEIVGEDLKGFAVTFIVGLSKDFVTGFGLRST